MGSNLEKMDIFGETAIFYRADMAGLGKYCMGGYCQIGVYRAKYRKCIPQTKGFFGDFSTML